MDPLVKTRKRRFARLEQAVTWVTASKKQEPVFHALTRKRMFANRGLSAWVSIVRFFRKKVRVVPTGRSFIANQKRPVSKEKRKNYVFISEDPAIVAGDVIRSRDALLVSNVSKVNVIRLLKRENLVMILTRDARRAYIVMTSLNVLNLNQRGRYQQEKAAPMPQLFVRKDLIAKAISVS